MIGKIYSSVIPYYDRAKQTNSYKKLHLNKISYVRTHKQTTVHRASLTSEIGDIKREYEDIYLKILEKLEEYNKKVMSDAL